MLALKDDSEIGINFFHGGGQIHIVSRCQCEYAHVIFDAIVQIRFCVLKSLGVPTRCHRTGQFLIASHRQHQHAHVIFDAMFLPPSNTVKGMSHTQTQHRAVIVVGVAPIRKHVPKM